jgi:hypothetical protein
MTLPTRDAADYIVTDLGRFVDLYEAYYEYVFSFLRSMGIDPGRCRVFYLNALLELHAIDAPPIGFNNMKAFLLRAARDRAQQTLRKRRPLPELPWVKGLSGALPEGQWRSAAESRGMLLAMWGGRRYEGALLKAVIRHAFLLDETVPRGDVFKIEVADMAFCVAALRELLQVLYDCHVGPSPVPPPSKGASRPGLS